MENNAKMCWIQKYDKKSEKKNPKKKSKSWNSGLNLCQGETIERLDYSIYSPIGKSNHGRVCIE
jgi:hypothetical protein